MKPELLVVFVAFVCVLAAPTFANRINSKLYDQLLSQTENHVVAAAEADSVTAVTNGDKATMTLDKQRHGNSVSYVKTSIPIRIFRCMQHLNILKCMKIFILQRMERTPIYVNSGNLTADFLDQLLAHDDRSDDNIFDPYYVEMEDAEINERLLKCFQRFFKDREIKLHFIPGMVVKVVPSAENAINVSLKRMTNSAVDYARKKNRPGEYLLNLGVPALMMPAIFVGTLLPFILPALKMAAMFSGFINHAALIAALMYTAKNAAIQVEAHKHLFYNHRASTS